MQETMFEGITFLFRGPWAAAGTVLTFFSVVGSVSGIVRMTREHRGTSLRVKSLKRETSH